MPVIFLLLLASASANGGVRFGLSRQSETLQSQGNSWVVQLDITNPTDREVEVQHENQLLLTSELLSRNVFEVEDITDGVDNAQRVPYIGKLAKLVEAEHRHTDKRVVGPMSSLPVSIDLSSGYQFNKNRKYRARMADSLIRVASTKVALTTDWIEFIASSDSRPPLDAHLEKTRHLQEDSSPSLQVVGSYTTSLCSTTEKNDLPTALANAVSGLDQDLDGYLYKGCNGTDYSEFFGTYSTSRYAEVNDTVYKARLRLNTGNFKVVCNDPSCPSQTYAFVYPTDVATHTVYLCSAYFSASQNLQQDSRPGTFVHELSHFNDIGATQDYVYGASACRSLGSSNPAQAVNNADCIEYFTEFQPGPCCGYSDCTSCIGKSTESRTCGWCTTQTTSGGAACTISYGCSSAGNFFSSATTSCSALPTASPAPSPTSPPGTESSGGSSVSGGGVAGIVIAILIVIAIVGAFLWWKQRQAGNRVVRNTQHTMAMTGGGGGGGGGGYMNQPRPMVPPKPSAGNPGVWQAFQTNEGLTYYYNTQTGQTQWDAPR